MMRAVFFDGVRSLTLRTTELPAPGPDEVRLQVRYCGICGSDLTVYKTGVLSGPDVILGHEVSAVVDLDPSGRLAPGVRVAPFPGGRGCGECVWCREGRYRYCVKPPRGRHGGGYAEYMVVRARDAMAIPDAVDERSAAVAEPLGVALRGIALANPQEGDLVYVQGLGPIGLFAVAGLVAAGCVVVGSDPRQDRRDLALGQGATDVFDPVQEYPPLKVLEYDAHGPRIAFECSGVAEALQQVIDACGPGGAVGILGIPMASVFLLGMTVKELRAFSIQGPSRESMEGALALLAERPHVAQVVTDVVPLAETKDAFDALLDGGGGGKVLVEPSA